MSLIVNERFAEVELAARFTVDWLAVNQKAKVAGVELFDIASSHVWPRLQSDTLRRAMGVWLVSWQSAEARFEEVPTSKFAWSREEGGKTIRCYNNNALLLNVQLLVLARLPTSVMASEATEFLPEPGAISISPMV